MKLLLKENKKTKEKEVNMSEDNHEELCCRCGISEELVEFKNIDDIKFCINCYKELFEE